VKRHNSIGPRPQRPAVLIADDEDIYLVITESMVKNLGLPVMTAHDGAEALAIFQEHPDEIGCVILDIQMPRMDGIATFRGLKKIRDNVLVIIASGYLDMANIEQLDRLHPIGYLEKPFTYQSISDLLRRYLPTGEQGDQ
jgi:two-component system, cell cycle sensor histidine kinase and response regulator CckA